MTTRGRSESFHGKRGIRSFLLWVANRDPRKSGIGLGSTAFSSGDSVRQADVLDAIQQLAVATLRSAQTLELVIYMV